MLAGVDISSARLASGSIAGLSWTTHLQDAVAPLAEPQLKE